MDLEELLEVLLGKDNIILARRTADDLYIVYYYIKKQNGDDILQHLAEIYGAHTIIKINDKQYHVLLINLKKHGTKYCFFIGELTRTIVHELVHYFGYDEYVSWRSEGYVSQDTELLC